MLATHNMEVGWQFEAISVISKLIYKQYYYLY